MLFVQGFPRSFSVKAPFVPQKILFCLGYMDQDSSLATVPDTLTKECKPFHNSRTFTYRTKNYFSDSGVGMTMFFYFLFFGSRLLFFSKLSYKCIFPGFCCKLVSRPVWRASIWTFLLRNISHFFVRLLSWTDLRHFLHVTFIFKAPSPQTFGLIVTDFQHRLSSRLRPSVCNQHKHPVKKKKLLRSNMFCPQRGTLCFDRSPRFYVSPTVSDEFVSEPPRWMDWCSGRR